MPQKSGHVGAQWAGARRPTALQLYSHGQPGLGWSIRIGAPGGSTYVANTTVRSWVLGFLATCTSFAGWKKPVPAAKVRDWQFSWLRTSVPSVTATIVGPGCECHPVVPPGWIVRVCTTKSLWWNVLILIGSSTGTRAKTWLTTPIEGVANAIPADKVTSTAAAIPPRRRLLRLILSLLSLA